MCRTTFHVAESHDKAWVLLTSVNMLNPQLVVKHFRHKKLNCRKRPLLVDIQIFRFLLVSLLFAPSIADLLHKGFVHLFAHRTVLIVGNTERNEVVIYRLEKGISNSQYFMYLVYVYQELVIRCIRYCVI